MAAFSRIEAINITARLGMLRDFNTYEDNHTRDFAEREMARFLEHAQDTYERRIEQEHMLFEARHGDVEFVPNPFTFDTSFPTCVPEDTVGNFGEPCPPDYVKEPLGAGMENTTCVRQDANSISSRAVDVILWDYSGKVTFGPDWPAGVRMTVLVFGNRDVSEAGNMRFGEVFEAYINNTQNERGVYYPDPHLVLLDGSDFYDGL